MGAGTYTTGLPSPARWSNRPLVLIQGAGSGSTIIAAAAGSAIAYSAGANIQIAGMKLETTGGGAADCIGGTDVAPS